MRVLAFASVGILASLALVLAGSDARAYDCGPGAHWVDTCAAGTDYFPATIAEFGVDLDLDLVPDIDVQFVGPTTVQRQAASDVSMNFPGKYGSSLDGHLDVIDTEIVSMNLVGVGLAGDFNLTMVTGIDEGVSNVHGVPYPSLGTIVEQAGDASLADSYFEVFFEVDGFDFGLFGYTRLHNEDPAMLEKLGIEGVPPIADYGLLLPFGPVALYDDADVLQAYLTELTTGGTGHHLTPEPGTGLLLGAGLIALAAARRSKRRL